jgi:hypothetical protein
MSGAACGAGLDFIQQQRDKVHGIEQSVGESWLKASRPSRTTLIRSSAACSTRDISGKSNNPNCP